MELKPGTQMDVRIATLLWPEYEWVPERRCLVVQGRGWFTLHRDYETAEAALLGWVEDQFRPSTDDADALLVWRWLPEPKRLHEERGRVTVMTGGYCYGSDSDLEHHVSAEGSTLAEAISRAALAWAEIKAQESAP